MMRRKPVQPVFLDKAGLTEPAWNRMVDELFAVLQREEFEIPAETADNLLTHILFSLSRIRREKSRSGSRDQPQSDGFGEIRTHTKLHGCCRKNA